MNTLALANRLTWLLQLFHRWAGICLCLFLALWFFSGFFMMYTDFPELSFTERLKGEAPINYSAVRLTPAQAASGLTAEDFKTQGTPTRNVDLPVEPVQGSTGFREITLQSYLGRPAYAFWPANETQPRLVFADNGEVLRSVDPRTAMLAAADFASQAALVSSSGVSHIRYRESVQADQWSYSSALNSYRPLHVIDLGDKDGTVLYVSARTGQVVRDTSFRERALNYFGAVTHYLAPIALRKYPDAWEWTVDTLAAISVILALAGLWIAVVRWRFTRRPGQSRIPYRGLLRWHYIAGAVFGIFVVTWAFSGWMSLNPGEINPSRTPTATQKAIYAGVELPLAAYGLPASSRVPADVREMHIMQFAGEPFWLATLGSGARQMVAAAAEDTFPRPVVNDLMQRAPKLMPNTPVAHKELLTRYDDYYYSRHPERGDKRLPIVRVEFNDPKNTWFYIDPFTGQVIERSTSTNRLFRWLYNGLHSFDIRWLWERRPLWDIVIITMCAGGFALSILGVIAGIRRLRADMARSRNLRRAMINSVPAR